MSATTDAQAALNSNTKTKAEATLNITIKEKVEAALSQFSSDNAKTYAFHKIQKDKLT